MTECQFRTILVSIKLPYSTYFFALFQGDPLKKKYIFHTYWAINQTFKPRNRKKLSTFTSSKYIDDRNRTYPVTRLLSIWKHNGRKILNFKPPPLPTLELHKMYRQGRRGRGRMIVWFTTTYAIGAYITTNVMGSTHAQGEEYNIMWKVCQ